jgi:hypothetical protein
LKENLEKRELQVNEILKATNLDPAALASLTRRLEDVLNAKNDQIKDLQYDLAKVTKVSSCLVIILVPQRCDQSIRSQAYGIQHSDRRRVFQSAKGVINNRRRHPLHKFIRNKMILVTAQLILPLFAAPSFTATKFDSMPSKLIYFDDQASRPP